jgi:hypothetical protein
LTFACGKHHEVYAEEAASELDNELTGTSKQHAQIIDGASFYQNTSRS